MIHVSFDDDPTSAAHWAAAPSRSPNRILVQISNRPGHKVRLPLDAAEANTFATALGLLVHAAPVTTIRSRELGAPGAATSTHWAAYSLAHLVRVDLCNDGDFAAVEMSKDTASDFARRVRAIASEFTAAGDPA